MILYQRLYSERALVNSKRNFLSKNNRYCYDNYPA